MRSAPQGQVAQLVEQGIENPRVGGSIPSLATTSSSWARSKTHCPRGSRRLPLREAGVCALGPHEATAGVIGWWYSRLRGVAAIAALGAAIPGCGTDNCERLCVEVGLRLDECLEEWPTDWGEVDASSRADFRRSCQDDWSSVRADLEPRELDDGLDQCADSSRSLARMRRSRSSCDQLRALYLGEP